MAQPANASIQTLRILWGAIFAATLLFLGVGLFSAQPSETYPATLGIVLAVAAMASAGASLLLPPFLLRQALGRAEVEVVEEPDPDADSLYRDQVSTRRVFADPDAARSRAMQLFYTPFILGCALAESVAIYGLVLLFLGAPRAQALPFFVISWVLLLTRVPTEAKATAPLEAALGAKLPNAD